MCALRILVSDIDGTLLDHGRPTPGLARLGRMVEEDDQVRLMYATGRSLESTRELIESGVLPPPHAVAALVGTEIWLPPWTEMDPDFEKTIEKGWNREKVLQALGGLPGLELQPDEFQTPRKVSYFVDHRPVLEKVRKRLRSSGARARMVYSGGRFLDVLPGKSGKKSAIEHLRRKWGVDRRDLLVCGDSGNDLDMLTEPGFMGVAVGNSKNELRILKNSDSVHFSKLPFAAGVLEGARAHGFWGKPLPLQKAG